MISQIPHSNQKNFKILFWCLHWAEVSQSKLEFSGWSEQTHLKGKGPLTGKQPHRKDTRGFPRLPLVWIQNFGILFKKLFTWRIVNIYKGREKNVTNHIYLSPSFNSFDSWATWFHLYSLLLPSPIQCWKLRSKAPHIIYFHLWIFQYRSLKDKDFLKTCTIILLLLFKN